MFILDFIRYFRGYVRFTAQGDFVERFLNLVARDKIPVWDGRKRQNIYTGYTDAKSYRLLRAHARKTGVRLRVQEKTGAPFQRRRYRKRTGLLVGLGIFAVFIFGMSLFIWRVEVSGNEAVPESTILRVLEESGVKAGVLRSSVDVRAVERQAMLSLEEMSWIALNIDGSVLRVEVNERAEPPDIADPDSPCNLVATHAGIIESVFVYEGQAMVQPGDAVDAGDILVSGITEDRLGQNLFRHAQAEVIATVEAELTVETPLAQTRLSETGERKKKGYLGIFSLELPVHLPFSPQGPYRVERDTFPLTLASLELPLSWLRETYVLMEETPVTLTEEEARAQAMQELVLLEKAELGNAEILGRSARGGLRDDSFVIEASYTCSMNIAREKEIFLSE